MKNKTIDRVVKDWEYCDLPTKQEIYMAEDRETAYNEGHSQGYSEGSKHEKISIIKQMLSKGLSKSEMTDITGISLEELQELLNTFFKEEKSA